MFRTLFGAPKSRPGTPQDGFRPTLEVLEDRLPPAPVMFPGTGTFTGSPTLLAPINDTTYPPPGGLYYGDYEALSFLGTSAIGVTGPTLPAAAVGPAGGVFAATAPTGGGGGAGGGTGGGAGGVLAQVGQVLAALYQMAAHQNPQAANALVVDEFFVGADLFVNTAAQAFGIHDANLQQSLAIHQAAVASNPLVQNQVGQMLGSLVFDLTLYTYASRLPGA